MLFKVLFQLPRLFLVLGIFIFTGCAISSLPSSYRGPEPRTAELNEYYAVKESYHSVQELIIEERVNVQVKAITFKNQYGNVSVEYYSHKNKTDDVVILHPMLGGRSELAKHFAEYLSSYGMDAAIIHRDNDFKNPANFERFEEICRRDALNTRQVLDLFEEQYQKKDFGSFGISRGAISAAIAAGIDERLKYNVFALGGSDIVGLFRDSDEGKIRRYVKKATESRGISEEVFYEQFQQQIRTDPKYLAKHIDARNTLLILGLFDSTVPIKYGDQLKEQLGNPRTIYLPSGHRTSGLYLQYISLIPPAASPGRGLFPFDYLESETLDFFRDSFERDGFDIKLFILRTLQTPMNLLVDLFE